MPWILRKFFKQHILCVVLFVCSILFFLNRKYIISAVFFIGCIMAYISIFVCRAAIKKSKLQNKDFLPESETRNVEYLIIGDMYKPTETGSYIQISAPNRSLDACYEILKHTHSILDDKKGKVILVIKKHNIDKNKYSFFDLPFLHEITIKRLKLSVDIGKLPVLHTLINLFGNLKFLFDIKSIGYKETDINADYIKKFCADRGYSLSFKIKK